MQVGISSIVGDHRDTGNLDELFGRIGLVAPDALLGNPMLGYIAHQFMNKPWADHATSVKVSNLGRSCVA
jgi:hypothetical protein